MKKITWTKTQTSEIAGSYNGQVVFTITRLENGGYWVVCLFGACEAYESNDGIISITRLCQIYFHNFIVTYSRLFAEEPECQP